MRRKFGIALVLFFGFLGVNHVYAQEKFTVWLDWYVNPDHGPLFVAEALGYFAEQGLQVDLIAPANPNDPPKLVAAKEGDIAVSYQPQLHLQVDQGLPLVRVGTLVATPLNSIVVLDKSAIRSINDLKGRKVGYSVAGFEDVLLASILEANGLTLSDVELINVNFSLSPAVMAGKVDAVIGAFRNFELNQMDIDGEPGRAFYLEEEGIPAYDELIYVAHSSRAQDSTIRKFLNAVEQATQFMINHPEDAWKYFVSFDDALDDELNRRAWRDTLPRFALRPGALDETRYQRFANFLLERDLIKKIPNIKTYAVEVK